MRVYCQDGSVGRRDEEIRNKLEKASKEVAEKGSTSTSLSLSREISLSCLERGRLLMTLRVW